MGRRIPQADELTVPLFNAVRFPLVLGGSEVFQMGTVTEELLYPPPLIGGESAEISIGSVIDACECILIALAQFFERNSLQRGHRGVIVDFQDCSVKALPAVAPVWGAAPAGSKVF